MRWDYNRSFESKKTCIKKSWWYYLFLAQEPFSSNILPTDEAGRGRRVVPFLAFFRVKNSPVLEFASTRFCCEDWKNCSAKFEKAIQQQQERKKFLHHNTPPSFFCCTLDLQIHERSGISVVGFPSSTKWECTPRTESKSIRNGKEWREGTARRRRRTSAVLYSGNGSFSLDGRDVITNSNPEARSVTRGKRPKDDIT